MMKTNDTALSAKQTPVPTATITTPASAGPTMRAIWKITLFRPIAFGTSAGSTSSGTNDWRVGLSIASTMPKATMIA